MYGNGLVRLTVLISFFVAVAPMVTVVAFLFHLVTTISVSYTHLKTETREMLQKAIIDKYNETDDAE